MSEPDIQARVRNFAQDAVKAFPILDVNGDQVVDRDEMRAAILNPNVTGTAAETAAALYMSAQSIQKLTGATPGGGVSSAQMASFAEKYAQTFGQCSANPPELANTFLPPTAWSIKTLLEFDKNMSRRVTEDEVPAGSGPVADFLRAHYNDIITASGGDPAAGFDLEALDKFMKAVDQQCGGAWDMGGILRRISQLRGETGEISRALFADEVNPVSSVKPDAIKQGLIGDCQFLASLAAVAAQTPEAIVRMIKDNGDGTYTVTFPGAPDEPIKVARPTDAELLLFNGAGRYGTWATVIEKAFAQYKKQHSHAAGNNELAQESINVAATPQEAMEMLTGKPVQFFDPMIAKPDELRNSLLTVARDGVPIVVGFGMFDQVASQRFDYPSNHAYTVLAFDPGGQDGGTVILRNPWGLGTGPKGISKISFKEFRTMFTGVYAGGKSGE